MKKTYIGLAIFGILLRFYIQFISPYFNVDEISLGLNIKESSFLQLLSPMGRGQSAPPLFLFLEKAIVMFSPLSFWINIKLLSFFSSIMVVFLVYKLIEKYNFSDELLVAFVIVLFNPFFVSNTLTVKQYSFDLLGILFLIYYYKFDWFKRFNFVFFIVWSLLSNIAIFSCVGFVLYLYFKETRKVNLSFLVVFLKKNVLTILSPLPYILYFIWFMKQEGATELRTYMIIYWHANFIPFNSSLLNFTFSLLHSFWVFFFSMNEILGISLFILSLISIFYLKKFKKYRSEIIIIGATIFIHIILNILHLYPISDRLFMYMGLFFLLLMSCTINTLLKIKIFNRFSKLIVILLSSLIFISYLNYFLYKENDVITLNKHLDNLHTTDKVYATNKSFQAVNEFNNFTNHKFKSKHILLSYVDRDLNVNNFYLITRLHNKLKPNSTSVEELIISDMKRNHQVNKLYMLQGYNVYKINKLK